MAIVTYVRRRMVDAGYLGHVKRNCPWGGIIASPAGGKSHRRADGRRRGVRQNRGCSDSGGVKPREGKVMVPHDEPQGAREVMEAGTLQVSREPRHKP